MADAHAKDGSVHITISGDPDELTPDEARQLADELIFAAAEAELQQRASRALCAVEHDWSQWINGYNAFRNHFRHCQRPNCSDGWEQYPGWMPFAARPHADMFGPRECSGPGCDHCATEDLGRAMRQVLSSAAAAMTIPLGGVALGVPEEFAGVRQTARLDIQYPGYRQLRGTR